MFGEWYRGSLSKIELTLRLPYLVLFAFGILIIKVIPRLLVFSILIWLLTRNIPISIFSGFILTLILEMFTLRGSYEKSILPKHLKNLEIVEGFYKTQNQSTNKVLAGNIERATKLSAWGCVNIAYIALPSWGWEIVFRIAFPLLVKNPKFIYHDLLIGFPNKSTEADELLWKVAQEGVSAKHSLLLDKYMHDFGGRISDADLGKPTLREQVGAIKSLILLYKNTDSPEARRKLTAEKREKTTKEVLNQLRVPKSLFLWLLSLVQRNVALREDRKYYEFVPDYYIRQMLIELGSRIGINKNDIFNKSWVEIKRNADV